MNVLAIFFIGHAGSPQQALLWAVSYRKQIKWTRTRSLQSLHPLWRMVPLPRPAGVGGGFGLNNSRTWRHLPPLTVYSGTRVNVQGPQSSQRVGVWGGGGVWERRKSSK